MYFVARHVDSAGYGKISILSALEFFGRFTQKDVTLPICMHTGKTGLRHPIAVLEMDIHVYHPPF